MSAPSSSTRPVTQPPSDSSCMRFKHRRNVLLPHPDGPITAVTVCAPNRRATSFTTARRPYRAVRRTVSSRSRTSGGVMTLPDGPAGCDAQDQHEAHEHERGGPREAVPLLERAGGVREDLERQRLHRLVVAGVEVRVARGGKQGGRGPAGEAGAAAGTPGEDAGGRGPGHAREGGAPPGVAERGCRFRGGVWHEPHHLFGGTG